MGWLLDVVILVILAVAAFFGWKRGFVKTLVFSTSRFVSLAVAFAFCHPISLYMEWTELPEVLNVVIAFLALWFATHIALYFAADFLTRSFDVPVLRTINRWLGVALSMLVSLLKVLAFCFIINSLFDVAELFGYDTFDRIDRESTYLFSFFSKINVFSVIK